ncbi:CUE domain-containing protein 5 [Echria macrotheca]|uniref:CUE domain-containing protein 5 n=1 Tax=Echria macrotheca TaxID=438768 RepID=A0AAJ0FGQ9_9PEZI|nr:CUE domain-containing protein 5 [Echria macrotheca]
MSAPADAAGKLSLADTPAPESPTTARPLEMDDDDIQDTGVVGADDASAPKTATTTPATASEEAAPPKPPRPMTEAQKNQQILKEAFPTLDPAVIKAVLTASGGRVEPAFNALLEMTDPDAAQKDLPPPPPPRPVAEPVGPTSTARSQLEADEEYARRLAEHYENVGAYEERTSNNRGPGIRGRQQTGLNPNRLYDDREHSFLDDDLPVIKESLRKGFVETQSKFNTWFTNIKKKVEEQFDEDDERHGQSSNPLMGRPTRDQTRRSADYDRYDADPELLSDDFAGMKFNSDGTPVRDNRQYGNPNLFKPPPPSKSPKPNDGRRVAFAETVEDINAYEASPKLTPKDASPAPGSGGKASKWQPLSAVEPSPIAENDPFSLGDSDDERDVKDKKEIKLEDKDDDALRKATADAMADSLVDDKQKVGGSGGK